MNRITPDGSIEFDFTPTPPASIRMSQPWFTPSVSLRVSPDPLGPVNKILSVMRNNRDGSTRMGRAVLYPVREGSVVTLGQENRPTVKFWDNGWNLRHADPGGNFWVVTVDEKRILEVPYHLALPDVPPAPPVPLWSRLRHWMTAKARSAADGAASRAGYVREDEGGEW